MHHVCLSALCLTCELTVMEKSRGLARSLVTRYMDKVLKGGDWERAVQVERIRRQGTEVGTLHMSREPPLAGTRSGVREGRQGAAGPIGGDEGRRLAANLLSRLDRGQPGMPSKGGETPTAGPGVPLKIPEYERDSGGQGGQGGRRHAIM